MLSSSSRSHIPQINSINHKTGCGNDPLLSHLTWVCWIISLCSQSASASYATNSGSLRVHARVKFAVLTTAFATWVIFKPFAHEAPWWITRQRIKKEIVSSDSQPFLFSVAAVLLRGFSPEANYTDRATAGNYTLPFQNNGRRPVTNKLNNFVSDTIHIC
jgi:hypothetical protein